MKLPMRPVVLVRSWLPNSEAEADELAEHSFADAPPQLVSAR
jgi:hypothetical protein